MYLWKEPKSIKIHRYNFNEEEVPLEPPKCLEIYSMFSSLCREPRWKEYKRSIKKVEYDMNVNLDITNIMRRLRFYGYAIDFLLDVNVKKSFKKLAERKPERYIDYNDNWDKVEGLTKLEKMRFYFYKKALLIKD